MAETPEELAKCASHDEAIDYFSSKSIQFAYVDVEIDLMDLGKAHLDKFVNTDIHIDLSRNTVKKMDMFIAPLVFEREEDFFLNAG